LPTVSSEGTTDQPASDTGSTGSHVKLGWASADPSAAASAKLAAIVPARTAADLWSMTRLMN
jgi:hypothetical protein